MEVGFITNINNFLIQLDGLPSAKINDLVESDSGARGWITALNGQSVDALILNELNVKPGQMFKLTQKSLTVNIGNHQLGRIINPLGLPLDGKGILESETDKNYQFLDQTASGISCRRFITKQLETGIALIDTLIPLGLGQRELVLGDARSGKTDFLTNMVINQKNTGVICIYALIGKPASEVKDLIDTLKTNKALDYTTIIATSSSDSPPLIFLAPQTAFTLAEHFQKQGKNVLVILDDMGIHAKIYREISLLSNQIPGRESYPGDIFYQHSHLLERAGNFKPEYGGGTITAIPVMEISLNDFTTYIPTNLMAMTDGHLLFKAALYQQGQKPAIDIPLSVSRVGLQTQNLATKLLSSQIKSILAQSLQFKTLSHFSGELPPQTQLIKRQSEIIEKLLIQEDLTFIPQPIQTMLFGLVLTPFFIKHGVNKQKIIESLSKDPNLLKATKAVYEAKNLQEMVLTINSIIPKLETLCRT